MGCGSAPPAPPTPPTGSAATAARRSTARRSLFGSPRSSGASKTSPIPPEPIVAVGPAFYDRYVDEVAGCACTVLVRADPDRVDEVRTALEALYGPYGFTSQPVEAAQQRGRRDHRAGGRRPAHRRARRVDRRPPGGHPGDRPAGGRDRRRSSDPPGARHDPPPDRRWHRAGHRAGDRRRRAAGGRRSSRGERVPPPWAGAAGRARSGDQDRRRRARRRLRGHRGRRIGSRLDRGLDDGRTGAAGATRDRFGARSARFRPPSPSECGMATNPAGDRGRVAAWSGVVGVAVAVTGALAVWTVGASAEHLRHTPSLFGVSADFAVTTEVDDPDAAAEAAIGTSSPTPTSRPSPVCCDSRIRPRRRPRSGGSDGVRRARGAAPRAWADRTDDPSLAGSPRAATRSCSVGRPPPPSASELGDHVTVTRVDDVTLSTTSSSDSPSPTGPTSSTRASTSPRTGSSAWRCRAEPNRDETRSPAPTPRSWTVRRPRGTGCRPRRARRSARRRRHGADPGSVHRRPLP